MAVRLLPPTAAAMVEPLLQQTAVVPPKVSGLLKDVHPLQPMAVGRPTASGLSMVSERKCDYPKAVAKRSHPKA